VPLTLGNAIIAVTEENNKLFPDRPVTEKKVSISTGINYGGMRDLEYRAGICPWRRDLPSAQARAHASLIHLARAGLQS